MYAGAYTLHDPHRRAFDDLKDPMLVNKICYQDEDGYHPQIHANRNN